MNQQEKEQNLGLNRGWGIEVSNRNGRMNGSTILIRIIFFLVILFFARARSLHGTSCLALLVCGRALQGRVGLSFGSRTGRSWNGFCGSIVVLFVTVLIARTFASSLHLSDFI